MTSKFTTRPIIIRDIKSEEILGYIKHGFNRKTTIPVNYYSWRKDIHIESKASSKFGQVAAFVRIETMETESVFSLPTKYPSGYLTYNLQNANSPKRKEIILNRLIKMAEEKGQIEPIPAALIRGRVSWVTRGDDIYIRNVTAKVGRHEAEVLFDSPRFIPL